ncbi:MAG: N-acetylmuramoyl-L-alanine amidase [Lachnospiraceae bacterium]|nr:N-acetylmuramoyl-L-alanine amidase [Lachnospiraceae bacterium]
MKEKIWGKIVLARKEAWGLLTVGLLLGIILAFCSEASSVHFLTQQVQKAAGYQQQVVWAATMDLADELEDEALREFYEKVAKLQPTFTGKKDSPVTKEQMLCLEADKNGLLVGIDPGHLGRTYNGYVNVGAVSTNGVTEYEFALEIGLLLKQELISRGYDVLMIRETNDRKNYKLDAGERAQMANEAECDILVALHWDSNDDPTHHGYHTIYKGNRQTESYRLALAISDAYGEAVEGNIAQLRRPMKRTDLWELNRAEMPTTFIEMGYASNESDALWLTNSENHSIIVEGIANGIDDFFFPDDVAK